MIMLQSKAEHIQAASIIMPAPTEQSGEEFQRALEDALGVAYLAVKDQKASLARGGAIQSLMSYDLLNGEQQYTGKVEVARKAFAESLLIIPQTLAESAGMDIMDVTVKLQNAPSLGVNVR